MPRERSGSSAQLTIYMAKDTVRDQREALRAGVHVEPHEVSVESSTLGVLHIQSRTPKPPRWSSLFGGHLDQRVFGKVNSSAAVLLVNVDDRIFALTFGNGRHLIASEQFEERFGLRVTLNSIGENSLRSIDKRTFDAIARHSKEQASRDVSARDFGLDIEQDLLRAVTGTSADPSLGRRMAGMDALSVSVDVTLAELPSLLRAYNEKYLDDSYRLNFPWVEQIAEVTDAVARQRLDERLFELVQSGDTSNVWMAAPELLPWERVSGFRYGRGARNAEHHDINLGAFVNEIGGFGHVSPDSFRRRHVECVDVEGVEIERWSAYRCLYSEFECDDGSYLLSGGRWYRVARGFVAQVDAAIARIPNYDEALPVYDDETEGVYNARAAAESDGRIALMDRELVAYGGGYNRVEYCDLYTMDCDIIHVKRYGQASALSHLFAQGVVSGELFVGDPSFRAEVNRRLPATHRIADVSRRPNNADYRVVFAIVSESDEELRLPFFSRLNLKHAASRLEAFGYRVAMAKIAVADSTRRMKRYRSTGRVRSR